MSSIHTPLLQKIKDHHASVNAAYTTYYGAGTSPSAPTSTRPSMDPSRSTSTSSMSKVWKSVKKAAREHHDGVNAAYATYYGGNAMKTSSSSASASRSASLESDEDMEFEKHFGKGDVRELDELREEKETTVVSLAWEKVKKAARKHHRGVNQAYSAYYGAGTGM